MEGNEGWLDGLLPRGGKRQKCNRKVGRPTASTAGVRWDENESICQTRRWHAGTEGSSACVIPPVCVYMRVRMCAYVCVLSVQCVLCCPVLSSVQRRRGRRREEMTF